MNREKEYAVKDFIKNIEQSWTYLRLTEDERKRFKKEINWCERQNIIKGNYLQRYHLMNGLYKMFLSGCGYKGQVNWRE